MPYQKSNKRQLSSRKTHDNNLSRLKIILTCYCSDYDHYDFVKPFLGALRANDWPNIYRRAADLSTAVYRSATEHLVAQQLAALVLKFPTTHTTFGLDKSPEDVAIETFLANEIRCKRSNKRFLALQQGRWTSFHMNLEKMRTFIYHLLGPLDLESIYDKCGWGPGANIGVHGNATSYARKLSSKRWTMSPTCLPYFTASCKRNYHIFEYLMESRNGYVIYDNETLVKGIHDRVEYAHYNKVTFVPKTAKTHRAIAIEPIGNSFVQKGVDLFLRERLRAFHCDLSDQGKNKYLAKIGSITNELCTIDLKAASDSISIELVRYLLPPEWFSFLCCIRSPAYLLNDVENRYEKFVSMGNGFCFPLETIIFLAAVRVFTKPGDLHAVYGDDIILPSKYAHELIKLLGFCGFVTNRDKTFLSGPFRESCGADWYEGQDVRPVYVDKSLLETSDVMSLHNAFLRSNLVKDMTVEVRDKLRSFVEPRQRFLRPDTVKYPLPNRFDELHEQRNLNGAFTVPLDMFMSSRWARWNKKEQRWSWREFIYTPMTDKLSRYSYLAYISFLQGNPAGRIALRRKVKQRVIVK